MSVNPPTASSSPGSTNPVPGVVLNSPVLVPAVALPAFDNTLGALFIGSNLATLLYGTICLQMFIYMTGQRGREDRPWLRRLTFLYYSSVDTVHQAMTTAAMYRFLVTDFMNPLALPSGGAASGEVFTYAQSVSGATAILLCQLFFSWRIWSFSGATMEFPARAAISVLTVLLALFSFGTSIDLAITGFNHRLLEANTPSFILAYKLSASSRIVFDTFVSFALTLSLYRSRLGIKRTDHIVKLLILFTVNTNLLTTLLSVSELATFLALPKATVYGGLGFLSPKTYFNTLLSSLNTRDYIRDKLDEDNLISSTQLPSSHSKSSGPSSFTKRKRGPRVEESLTFSAQTSQGVPGESYEMGINKKHELEIIDIGR